MAGPGGGPPRRSHTKSRKGCEACKRRHIRCDESFPQCRNCTKHKTQCPYMKQSVPDERAITADRSEAVPDVRWTPAIEAVIDEWQLSLKFPYGNMLREEPDPRAYSRDELCLIYHAATAYHELEKVGANGFTLWSRHIPDIISLGASHPFVMNALLAFVAEYLAFRTSCPLVGNMAYEHRGKALRGLGQALDAFSPANSDAVLCATLVLSWQATDWRSWNQLLEGASSVMVEMEKEGQHSGFGDFVANKTRYPTARATDRNANVPGRDSQEAFQGIVTQLARVEAHLKHQKKDTTVVQQLSSFLKGAPKVGPIHSTEDRFDRLRPLRTWLLWLPVDLLMEQGPSPSVLLVTSQYYASAMVMERLFPDFASAYFGGLAIQPVEAILHYMLSLDVSGLEPEVKVPLELMSFAFDTSLELCRRLGLDESGTSTPSLTVPLSPFDASPQADLCISYGSPSVVDWSTEDAASDSEPYSARFLNIPCSSYGGASSFGAHSPYGTSPYGNYSPPFSGPGSVAGSPCFSTPSSFSAVSPALSTLDEGFSSTYHDDDSTLSHFVMSDHSHLGTQPTALRFPPLDIPAHPSHDTHETMWQSDLWDAQPSPYSTSASSSRAARSPPWMHHRHNSSVSSLPSLGPD